MLAKAVKIEHHLYVDTLRTINEYFAKMAYAEPRRAEPRREIGEALDEKYVNFLGVPPSSSGLGDQTLSCGWLRIRSQEDLEKALDCEDAPWYAKQIRPSRLLEVATGPAGILGRITRTNPEILELAYGSGATDRRGMVPDRVYAREVRDHPSCDEYGVGLQGRSSGLMYIHSEDGEYIPHDEVRPEHIAAQRRKIIKYFVVYKLRRISATRSASSAAGASAVARVTETEPADTPASPSADAPANASVDEQP